MGKGGRLAGMVAALWAGQIAPLQALDLTLPAGATETARTQEAFGSLRLATGAFSQGTLPTQLAEGRLSITSFRLPLAGQSSADVMKSLQVQAKAAGFSPVFSCEADLCGGYDFRYGINILPEPDMHVNLGDFHYHLAQDGKGDFVMLLVSASAGMGFVQVTQLGEAVQGAAIAAKAAAPTPDPLAQIAPQPPANPASTGLVAALESGKSVVLEDLIFASGTSALVSDDYPSLAVLAEWLSADPARKVVLVGHTDASGGLEANIKLSRLRAESVRQTLLYAQKIAPDQVQAEGVGPLSPRVSNLTEEGRRQNRRVEVMMTSTALLTP